MGSEEAQQRAAHAAREVARLTPRQRQVLALMVADHSNKQIAATLGIDEKTVKMHRAGLMKRLGTGSSGAVRIAVEASFASAFARTPAIDGDGAGAGPPLFGASPRQNAFAVTRRPTP